MSENVYVLDDPVLAGDWVLPSHRVAGRRPAIAPVATEPPAERSSWAPLDLGPFLDGTYEPPRAGLLTREDGAGLFYAGRVHWVMGEPESGKSWIALITAARVLADGGRVLYLDHESEPGEVVSRLLTLGVGVNDIRTGFSYVHPDRGVNAIAEISDFAELLAKKYTLAVIDGVTDAVGIDGKSVLNNDEVADWMRRVPRKIASRTGAAVIAIDHVAKGGGGRYAIGAQAKLAGVDGAVYIVKPLTAVAPGKQAELELRVVKDRPGAVRAQCPPWRGEDRSQEAARVLIDARDRDHLIVTIAAPKAAATGEAKASGFRPTGFMEKVSRLLERNPDGMSGNAITKQMSGKAQTINLAINALREEGYVREDKEGRRYSVNISVQPYREAGDLIGGADDGTSLA